MAQPPAKGAVSAALQSRELNGDVLLDELNELRMGAVQQAALIDMSTGARDMTGMRVSEAQQWLKSFGQRFPSQPALGNFLNRWSQKLKSDHDVPLLVSHLERLAQAAVVMSALRRCTERLPKGGRG
jgi:hypothetical protein